MRDYFPFTNYDFYAYLTSGALTLAVLDYAFNQSALLTYPSWNFVLIVAAVALAYVVGHIIATFSQLVFETIVTGHLIAKPMTLQLGLKRPNWFEATLGVLVGRYYGPLSNGTRDQIIKSAAADLQKPAEEVTDPEEVFQIGFRKSFSNEGVRVRIDDFRNQYGFCRNVALVALLATLIFSWNSAHGVGAYGWYLPSASALVCLGMFIRFVKFLSSFQAEVLRVVIK